MYFKDKLLGKEKENNIFLINEKCIYNNKKMCYNVKKSQMEGHYD